MMMQHYMVGIFMLLVSTFLEVSTYPSKPESTSFEDITELPEISEERSLAYDETNIENEDAARDILKKISEINEALKKPNRRFAIPWNPKPPQINTGNVLDEDILKKLQQVIASGKLHSYSNIKRQDTNNINNQSPEGIKYSRQIPPVYTNNAIAPMPMPYMTNMPVLIMPTTNNMYAQKNFMDLAGQYQTKEGPSFSFQPFQFIPQLQTPFAGLFPILFRDPFVSAISGSSFIEYGQSADVCKRHQKSERNANDLTENDDLEISRNGFSQSTSHERKSREKRAIKKRTVNHRSQLQEIDKDKKFFSLASTTTKPNKKESNKVIKTTDEGDEDLRFSFLLGQKDRPPNGPGFFINRLKVRKGGVAIAGPGGVATAGHGGTAIVGPGGLAYTQPGGIAVAGPAARVIALSADADLTSVAHRLQQQSTIDGSVSKLLQAIPEGKHVATGPVIYFHPNNRSYGGREWKRDGTKSENELSDQQDTFRYNGVDFQEAPLKADDATFMLIVKPIAHARSTRGMAIANPISQIIIAKNNIATIVHAPLATAVVGPGGIAHAQSDLYLFEYVTE